MNTVKALFLAAVVIAVAAVPAWGQSDQASNAPQILTSDLVAKQKVDSQTMVVHFVIVDTSNVTQVLINGEPQAITPGDTVAVNKEFTFKPGRQLIEIEAVDEKGNRDKKTFLVLYGKDEQVEEEKKFTWQALVKVGFDIDDNPTNDLGSPIPIAGLKLQGAVPDNEQADTRTTLQGILAASYGDLSGYVGLQNVAYGKPKNKPLGAQIMFLGGSYNLGLSESASVMLGLSFTDINIGGNDYSQIQTLSPAFVLTGSGEKGTHRNAFAFDFGAKSFAESARKAASEYALHWDYSSADKAHLDSYAQSFKYGTSTEGTPESEYTYFGLDFDWKWMWESGVKSATGFGYQYRRYPHDVPLTADTPLGSVRADNLLRYSFGFGYGFLKTWSAMLNYQYLTDLSNKSPYIRQIYGLTVDGAF